MVLAVGSLAAVIAETAVVVDVVSIPPHLTRTPPSMLLMCNHTLFYLFSVHFTPRLTRYQVAVAAVEALAAAEMRTRTLGTPSPSWVAS